MTVRYGYGEFAGKIQWVSRFPPPSSAASPQPAGAARELPPSPFRPGWTAVQRALFRNRRKERTMTDLAIADHGFSGFVRENAEKMVDSAARRKMLRKRLLIALGALLVLAAAGFGAHWWWI